MQVHVYLWKITGLRAYVSVLKISVCQVLPQCMLNLFFNKKNFLSLVQLYRWEKSYIIHALNITDNSLAVVHKHFLMLLTPHNSLCTVMKCKKTMKTEVFQLTWTEVKVFTPLFIPPFTEYKNIRLLFCGCVFWLWDVTPTPTVMVRERKVHHLMAFVKPTNVWNF